jgi:hypothetical protein
LKTNICATIDVDRIREYKLKLSGDRSRVNANTVRNAMAADRIRAEKYMKRDPDMTPISGA